MFVVQIVRTTTSCDGKERDWIIRTEYINIILFFIIIAIDGERCSPVHQLAYARSSFFSVSRSRRKARFWINCRWKFAFQVIIIVYSLVLTHSVSRHFHEVVALVSVCVDLWNISQQFNVYTKSPVAQCFLSERLREKKRNTFTLMVVVSVAVRSCSSIEYTF